MDDGMGRGEKDIGQKNFATYFSQPLSVQHDSRRFFYYFCALVWANISGEHRSPSSSRRIGRIVSHQAAPSHHVHRAAMVGADQSAPAVMAWLWLTEGGTQNWAAFHAHGTSNACKELFLLVFFFRFLSLYLSLFRVR